VFSFIVFKSRADRDRVNAKVMKIAVSLSLTGLLNWPVKALRSSSSCPVLLAIGVIIGRILNSEETKDKPKSAPKEKTPNTNAKDFERIKVEGKPAFRDKETGEVWIRDEGSHYGGPHWEVYRNKRDAESGKRDRTVSNDGKTLRQHGR
jgi:hypothetical protein